MQPNFAPNTQRFFFALLVASALGACAGPRGGQRWVATLNLKGTHQLKAGEVIDGLATQETGWWPFATRQAFTPAVLEQDLERIVTFYAARGFFRAKVKRKQVVPRAGERSVDITLHIDEGPPTLIKAIVLLGVETLDKTLQRTLRERLALKVEERFVYSRYARGKKSVVALLRARGYAYAKAEGQVEVNRKRHEARLRLSVTTGPLVRYGRVKLEGNGTIPADKILNLIRIKTGQRHDHQQLSRARARLFRQQVFSSVTLNLPKAPTERADLTIHVKPSKLRELRLGVGLGVDRKRQEVHLKGVWTWRNFLGGLRTLEVRLQPSYVAMPVVWDLQRDGPAVELDVKLTQPDFYGSGLTLFGALGYDLGIHEGYRFHGPRGQVGINRAFFNDRLSLGVSYNLQFLDFFDKVEGAFDPSTTPLGLGFVDPFRPAWIEPFVRLDLRDDLLNPRSGALFELRFEQGLTALGGEFTYFKTTPEARTYLPLGTKRIVLATRALFGYLRPSTGQSSPITRRYNFGGPTLHRGFSYGRLAPQDSATRVPRGGNGALLLSADLRLRLFRLAGHWLGFTGFCDAGDVVAEVDDLEIDKLHLAVGGSLSYDTPVGLIRIALGVRLNRLDETSDGRQNPDPGARIAFHLTIGAAF
ncbi:MAG: BamA/TamA family outer membrane protein [Deltaproteobacteria bacterium]|nr:BamA/TamA family outer membrane protein [Deltaproteobacteria bacterium]